MRESNQKPKVMKTVVSHSLPDFESCDKPNFIEKYKDVCSEELLIKIWEFGNSRWSNGYNKGKNNPEFH